MSAQISSTQNVSPSIPDDLREKTFDEGATQKGISETAISQIPWGHNCRSSAKNF